MCCFGGGGGRGVPNQKPTRTKPNWFQGMRAPLSINCLLRMHRKRREAACGTGCELQYSAERPRGPQPGGRLTSAPIELRLLNRYSRSASTPASKWHLCRACQCPARISRARPGVTEQTKMRAKHGKGGAWRLAGRPLLQPASPAVHADHPPLGHLLRLLNLSLPCRCLLVFKVCEGPLNP